MKLRWWRKGDRVFDEELQKYEDHLEKLAELEELKQLKEKHSWEPPLCCGRYVQSSRHGAWVCARLNGHDGTHSPAATLGRQVELLREYREGRFDPPPEEIQAAIKSIREAL